VLKAGIFVDAENVTRNGGWGMRYDVLREFVAAQGAQVVRANAYLALDQEREYSDPEYHRKREAYRSRLRSCGFKLGLKNVKRYHNDSGEVVTKANTDLDLAIDAMLQARNLDYVVIVSGDGDFARLVMALQDYGCRVDVVGFHNVSRDLRKIADNYCSGFLIPGLMPTEEGRLRGYFDVVNEEKYYGFIVAPASLELWGQRETYFCHGSEVEGGSLSNQQLSKLLGNHHVVEFAIREDPKGLQAMNVQILRMPDLAARTPDPNRSAEPARTAEAPRPYAVPRGDDPASAGYDSPDE
jgi:uncharacterized LabA/DUF88 family protein/cold shock CspA family protein